MSATVGSAVRAVSPRLLAGLAAAALLLTLVCVLAAHSLGAVDDSLQAVARTEYAQAQLIDIDQSLSDVVNAARAYERTQDPDLLSAFEHLQPHIDAALDRLDALVPSPGLSRYGVDALAALARDREQFAAVTIQAVRRGDLGAARLLVERGEGKSSMDAVRTTIASLQTEARRVLSLEQESIARSRRVFLVALWLSGTVAVLLLAFLAGTVLRRSRERRGPGANFVNVRQSL